MEQHILPLRRRGSSLLADPLAAHFCRAQQRRGASPVQAAARVNAVGVGCNLIIMSDMLIFLCSEAALQQICLVSA
jgi:hypothetical protein